MTGDRPAALAHQGGGLQAVGLAAFPNRGHHVVGVILQGVIGGGRRGRATAVVVDPQAAPHIQVAHRGAKTAQLHVELGGLLQGIFEHGDVIDLTAHVEMQQAQIRQQSRLAQRLHGGEQIGHRQAELGPLPHGTAPMTRATGGQLGAHTDQRSGAQLAAGINNPLHLIELLNHHHRLATQLPSQDCRLHIAPVLISIADQQGLRVLQ